MLPARVPFACCGTPICLSSSACAASGSAAAAGVADTAGLPSTCGPGHTACRVGLSKPGLCGPAGAGDHGSAACCCCCCCWRALRRHAAPARPSPAAAAVPSGQKFDDLLLWLSSGAGLLCNAAATRDAGPPINALSACRLPLWEGGTASRCRKGEAPPRLCSGAQGRWKPGARKHGHTMLGPAMPSPISAAGQRGAVGTHLAR